MPGEEGALACMYVCTYVCHCVSEKAGDRIKAPDVKYTQFPVTIHLYGSRSSLFYTKLYLYAPKIRLLTLIIILFNPGKAPTFGLRSILTLCSHLHLGLTLVIINSAVEEKIRIVGGLKQLI
jgi:hypothetical protein